MRRRSGRRDHHPSTPGAPRSAPPPERGPHDRLTAPPAISLLSFRQSNTAEIPFDIGRLETTHRLRTSTRPHRHGFHQILWVVDGAGAHTVDFEEHAIGPQTVFLISPGQVHAVRVDRPLRGYMLVFTADFLALDGSAAVAASNAAGLPFFRPGAANPVLTLTDDEAHRLRGIAEDLLTELASRAAWRRDMVRARFQTLLLALGRAALRQDVPVAPLTSSVARFQALVEERFRSVHRVADYARLLALTPGHLSDRTRAATGQTASALIDARLILEARRLLAHSDAPASPGKRRPMNRRSILFALPSGAAALTAAYVFNSAHAPKAGPADALAGGGCGGDVQPPAAAVPPAVTAPRGAADPVGAPPRAQPLPLPPEDDRSWLQDWLDLISSTSRNATSGC